MLHWDLGAVLFWMGVGLLFSTLAAVIVRLLREPERCRICGASETPLATCCLLPLLPSEPAELVRCCPGCVELLATRAMERTDVRPRSRPRP